MWLLVLLLALTAGSPAAWAFDMDGYKSRLSTTLAEVGTKSLTNSKATLARLDEMVAIGLLAQKSMLRSRPASPS